MTGPAGGPGRGPAGRLGIFARTFRRHTPEQVAAAVAQAAYALAQSSPSAPAPATRATCGDPTRQPGPRCLDRAAPHPGAAHGRRRRRRRPPRHRTRTRQRRPRRPTAARLLGELGEDAPVGIVLDPANLLSPETVPRQSEVLAEAVDLLGPRVVGIQLKDVTAAGHAGAAGTGLLDYPACSATWPGSLRFP